MKTKRQVMEEFFRLQKKWSDKVRGFVEISLYNGDGGYWSVKIKVSWFGDSHEIVWREEFSWDHYSRQNEEEERTNEVLFAEFIKKVEEHFV